MKPAPKPLPKRAYENVSLKKQGQGGEFALLLDDKPALTPLRIEFNFPNHKLAEAVAQEFRAQGARIDPGAMPMTRLATIAIDVAGEKRAELTHDLAGYAETDLLCYRAEGDAVLAGKQEKEWGRVLDWLNTAHNFTFVTTSGVIPVPQPEASLLAMRNWLESIDKWHLSVAAVLVRYTGSLILARAAIEKTLDAEALTRLSQLDEDYQSEAWGEEAEKAAKRLEIAQEIRQAVLFLDLLG